MKRQVSTQEAGILREFVLPLACTNAYGARLTRASTVQLVCTVIFSALSIYVLHDISRPDSEKRIRGTHLLWLRELYFISFYKQRCFFFMFDRVLEPLTKLASSKLE